MVETAKQRSFSLKRKVVGEKAAQILQGKDIFQTVCETIKPYYANVFEVASQSTGNMNEALFAAFRTFTVDDNLSSEGTSICWKVLGMVRQSEQRWTNNTLCKFLSDG